jgi:ParB family chromosome partitioning protein
VVEVRPRHYVLVHGERRWRAAQLAGLESIPAVVRRRDYDSVTRFVRQMVENIQREDLNDVDRAAGLVRLKELLREEIEAEAAEREEATPWAGQMTWAKVGKRLGYSRQRIHQLIQLLKLPDEIKEAVREGRLSERDTRIYQGLRVIQQRELHQARMAGRVTPREMGRVARQLKERPDKSVTIALEEVRHTAEAEDEPSGEPPFETLLGSPAVRPVPERRLETTLAPRRNAQNINRVHWARDHLSRIQAQGLAAGDQRELRTVLAKLREELDGLLAALQGRPDAEE